MRRILTAAAFVLTAVLLSAGPAWAHEEIDPSSFPTGKPVFLTLSAANEKKVDLVKISLAAPAGGSFGEATREPGGWSVERSPQAVSWSGGAVKPEAFEQWGFEVEAVDQPGQLQYKVTLGFADGGTEEADVVVDAIAPAGASGTVATTAVASPATTIAAGTGAGQAAVAPTPAGSGRADAALAVAVVAGVVALAALAVAARRRSPARADTGSPRSEQDF